MTVVAAVLAAALVAVVWLLTRSQAAQRDAHAQAEQRWFEERRELLNRVQRPEYLPLTVPKGWEPPEATPDYSDLVGTVADPPEGLEE